MNIKEILYESKVDDFKLKYQQKFGSENVDRIVSMVLPKYLEWVGKHLDSIGFDDKFHKLTGALNKFNKIYSNLPITDINGYKSVDELINAISDYEKKERRVYQEVQGGNLVYEDERFYVVNPLTHEASCYYGSGTKWCTAAQSDERFNEYNIDGKLFYVLDKRLQTSDPYYKVAILRKFDGGESYWDARDTPFNKGWILNTDEYNNIEKEIVEYMGSEFSEQIKVFSDKEAAKKEKERLERVRLAQILRQKEEEAEERRLDGEWELDSDCPEEGLKAHALLEWLVDTSDVNVLTNEDKIEIQRLKDEIERLNAEYDAGEGPNTELLDEISDLEDELTELQEKIDVYNIIPLDDDYYSMSRFEVINGGLDDREYAVGTDDEIHSSCYETVENKIENDGVYDGFSKHVLYDNIDTDYVRSYAEDMFNEFVYNEPNSYFDESERELSARQIENIQILKNKIEKLEQLIEKLEEKQSYEDDEEIYAEYEEKIDELKENLEEINDEITEIEENPDGDFPDSLIEEKVEELVEDAVKDEIRFIRDWDLSIERFIDKDSLIEDVISQDGYGLTINSCDGNADEVYVNGKLYYVIRLN